MKTVPRRKVKILQANHSGIIWEGVVGSRERFQVPKSIRGLLKKGEKVKVTIEKVVETEKE